MRRWPNITRQASMRWLRTGGTDVAQDSDAGGGDRWVVIAEEPDQLSAEIVLQFLRGAAIPARLAAGDAMSFLGPSMMATRVLVPREWEQEALVALERRGEDEMRPPGVVL